MASEDATRLICASVPHFTNDTGASVQTAHYERLIVCFCSVKKKKKVALECEAIVASVLHVHLPEIHSALQRSAELLYCLAWCQMGGVCGGGLWCPSFQTGVKSATEVTGDFLAGPATSSSLLYPPQSGP